MICYFVRHGLAADAAQWRGSDFDRPLTEQGIARTAAVAKRFAKVVTADVGAIVTSPLLRAKQTAEIVALALDLRDRLVEDARLGGGFDVDGLSEILQRHAGAEAIVLVGHEPDMSATVGHAIGGARLEFKKAAIACVDFRDPPSAYGELLWMAPPKVLLG